MSDKLHVYGQRAWHDDLVVAGDEEGLRTLRDAIDEVLKDDGCGEGLVYTNDGEGYKALILRVDDMDNLPVPYEAEYAEEVADERWANLRDRLDVFYDDS